MRVDTLQLSNILSFKYETNIDNAFKIIFDPALNIIIGGNGSGKSTALEALNFIFRRVILRHYEFHQQHFNDARLQQNKAALTLGQQAKRITPFRLHPNWQTEEDEQAIKITVTLDEVDKLNIQTVVNNQEAIRLLLEKYSNELMPSFRPIAGGEQITITIKFSSADDSFSTVYSAVGEHVKFYLENYVLLSEVISIHNKVAADQIRMFSNTFSMLSAFRNYTTFSLNTSLSSDPQDQMRSIRNNDSNRSNNDGGGEPPIFNVVKLQLGEQHFKLMHGNDSSESAVKKVNSLDLVKSINKKLSILNLEFSAKVVDTRNWSYEFNFYDTKHKREMGNINNLSAGQKSIIHLIFEAYGRDNAKGGVVVIDEPEIHLHYQFQYEYLRILEELSAEISTQYIVVTHSDGFVSSGTAGYLKRFSLDTERYSTVCAPTLTTDRKKLVEILDNTQSARALFANKVVLVEGPSDEYFFRSLFKSYAPEFRQEVAIYRTGGKDNSSWKDFFESFGVIVYQIKDLDATAADIYNECNVSLKSEEDIANFKSIHTDIVSRINEEYSNKCFYLKAGALEQYTQKPKKMEYVINFCENIEDFLSSGSEHSKEMIKIIDTITEQET